LCQSIDGDYVAFFNDGGFGGQINHHAILRPQNDLPRVTIGPGYCDLERTGGRDLCQSAGSVKSDSGDQTNVGNGERATPFGGTSCVKLGYCRWQDSAHDPSSAATIDASQNSSSRETRREPTDFAIT
jgi:hypothetical protein